MWRTYFTCWAMGFEISPPFSESLVLPKPSAVSYEGRSEAQQKRYGALQLKCAGQETWSEVSNQVADYYSRERGQVHLIDTFSCTMAVKCFP
jgi:hypothetical protein